MTLLAGATAGDVRDRIDTAVRDAFMAATAHRARGAHSLSMSRLGGCTRAAAYTVAGTAPTDEPAAEEGRAANLGTWEHEGFLPWLVRALGGDAAEEVPVELHAAGLLIPGRADVTGLFAVDDLKTVGEHRLHSVRRAGTPFPDHWVQVMGYALGRRQAGHDVQWVTWIYMDRANGDHETFVEAFTDATALAVIDRVREIRNWAEADPDRAPREGYRPPGRDRGQVYRGPGLSLSCNTCPWLRRCWGPNAIPGEVGAQTNLAADEPGAADALALYDDASARASAARADQDYAKAILASTRSGFYGEWSLRHGKPGRHLDEAAVAARYAELGEEPPRTATTGRLLVRLTARLSKAMRADIGTAPDVDA